MRRQSMVSGLAVVALGLGGVLTWFAGSGSPARASVPIGPSRFSQHLPANESPLAAHDPRGSDPPLAPAHVRRVPPVVSGKEVWSGSIEVTGDTLLGAGADVEVLAGTHVRMRRGARLRVRQARFVVAGLPEVPVVFESEESGQGTWGGLLVQESRDREVALRHVRVRGAGSQGASLWLEAPTLLEDVQVDDSANWGVVAQDFAPGSRDLRVRGAELGGLRVTAAPALRHLPASLDLEGRPAAVTVARIDEDVTLSAEVGEYRWAENLEIGDGGVLRVPAGTRLAFARDRGLSVWPGARLELEGTALRPVVLCGQEPGSGRWRGLTVRSSGAHPSELRHASIQGAGAGQRFAFELEGAALVEDLGVIGSDRGVLIAAGARFAAGSQRLSVAGVGGLALEVHGDGIGHLPPGSRFTGNLFDAIRIADAVVVSEGKLRNFGVPYRLSGELRLAKNSTLHVEPGVSLVPDLAASIVVEGSLRAVGTAQAPIVLGPEQGTLGASWAGLRFDAEAALSSVLRHVRVQGAVNACTHAATVSPLGAGEHLVCLPH